MTLDSAISAGEYQNVDFSFFAMGVNRIRALVLENDT